VDGLRQATLIVDRVSATAGSIGGHSGERGVGTHNALMRLRRQVIPMANIDVDIDTNFPDRTVEDAIDKINAERSRKRLIALSGIALALLTAALSTYLAYA
jgi:hypothetical protein